MNTMKLKLVFLGCVLFSVLPHSAAAYNTTEQQAIRINEHFALYTIKFSLGSSDRSFAVPIGMTRTETDVQNLLGFSMRIDGKDVTDTGLANGIVLANAPVVDGQYHVAQGKRTMFTAVVLFNTDSDTPEADYALKIDHLPFTTNDGNVTVENRLTESELSYYVTPEIELNQDSDPLIRVNKPRIKLSL